MKILDHNVVSIVETLTIDHVQMRISFIYSIYLVIRTFTSRT